MCRMARTTTFIIHANQTVTVRSRHGYWPPETLRSKPTFSIVARDLPEALRIAEKQVRTRYENADTIVDGVSVTAALVREVRA
jgi:hypothetical protein